MDVLPLFAEFDRGPQTRPDFCRLDASTLTEFFGPLRVISEPLHDETVELMLLDRDPGNFGFIESADRWLLDL